jgi:hypothetical protein
MKSINNKIWDAAVLVLLTWRTSHVRHLDGLTWHDVHTKFHKDPLKHSNNVGIISTIESLQYYWWDGFVKYAGEVALDRIIYTPGFVKINSGIQVILRL